MSGTAKAWMVAVVTSIGSVEVLKDRGFCGWNYGIRSLQPHARNNISKSFANARMVSASSREIFGEMGNNEVKKKSKEFMMEKVVNLGCLGPNTVRF